MSSPIATAESLTEPAEPPQSPVFTPGFALLVGVQLCFGLSFSTFFLLPKFVAVELHGDANAIGQITSIATLSSVVTAPLVGGILDRGRRAPFITFGTLATALCALAFTWVDQVGPLAYALRVVQGIAFSLVFNAAATLISDLAPPARLGQAFGWFGAAALSTNAIAPATAEWIAEAHGWPAVFVSAAGAGLVASALSLFVREPPLSVATATTRAPSEALLRGRGGILYAMAAAGAGFGVMFTFTQPLALELGETRVSGLFLGYTAAAVFVRLALGSAADRLGRKRVALWALALYALVVATTAALRPGLLPLYGLGFGIAHGLFYPALSAFAIEAMGRARRGMLTTLINASFNLGVSAMVATCGVIAKFTSYRLVFLLAGLSVASGVIALARAGTRPGHPELK